MNKTHAWTIYVVVSIISVLVLIFGTPEDPNYKSELTQVTVVKLLQEDHKSSTDYRGVFLLPNGKYTDFKITPATYVTAKPGDILSFKLNKYEKMEANESDRTKTILSVFILFVLTILWILIVPSLIVDYYKSK